MPRQVFRLRVVLLWHLTRYGGASVAVFHRLPLPQARFEWGASDCGIDDSKSSSASALGSVLLRLAARSRAIRHARDRVNR